MKANPEFESGKRDPGDAFAGFPGHNRIPDFHAEGRLNKGHRKIAIKYFCFLRKSVYLPSQKIRSCRKFVI